MDLSARNLDTDATTGSLFTVTVVFALFALVPTLVVSTKVNVVVAENVFGVKTKRVEFAGDRGCGPRKEVNAGRAFREPFETCAVGQCAAPARELDRKTV